MFVVIFLGHYSHSVHTDHYQPKDNTVNRQGKDMLNERISEMKGSHFDIGKNNASMVNPKPLAPLPANNTRPEE